MGRRHTAVHVSLVVDQIEFTAKDDKACLQALDVVAEKMEAIKVSFEGFVVSKELIGQIVLFLANMAFVVVPIQVLV